MVSALSSTKFRLKDANRKTRDCSIELPCVSGKLLVLSMQEAKTKATARQTSQSDIHSVCICTWFQKQLKCIKRSLKYRNQPTPTTISRQLGRDHSFTCAQLVTPTSAASLHLGKAPPRHLVLQGRHVEPGARNSICGASGGSRVASDGYVPT